MGVLRWIGDNAIKLIIVDTFNLSDDRGVWRRGVFCPRGIWRRLVPWIDERTHVARYCIVKGGDWRENCVEVLEW